MANEIQWIIPYIIQNNVTKFTVKHASYTNATIGYLIQYPISSQIQHTLFDIISLGVDAVLLCMFE